MSEAPKFTIDQIIQLRNEAKDALAALAKKHDEERKPYENRFNLCDAWLLKFLNETGQESARTEHGTAYKSTVMSATVDPEGGWEKMLSYVLGGAIERALDVVERDGDEAAAVQAMLAEPALALLNHAVNKTAVKEIMEQHGAPPPGVKISHITNVGVRRS